MLVLDLGGQYAQLIARRVREARVYSELVPYSVTPAEVRARNPRALVLSGGPASVYAEGAPRVDPELFSLGVPASSRPVSRTVRCERPNSPTSAPSTRPPSVSTSACMP